MTFKSTGNYKRKLEKDGVLPIRESIQTALTQASTTTSPNLVLLAGDMTTPEEQSQSQIVLSISNIIERFKTGNTFYEKIDGLGFIVKAGAFLWSFVQGNNSNGDYYQLSFGLGGPIIIPGLTGGGGGGATRSI